jgi:GYF domain 2
MGIRFDCEHCGRTLNVKDFLAGKRGICPKCGGRIEIPATTAQSGSLSAAAAASNGNSASRAAEATLPAAVGATGPGGMVSPVGVARAVDPIAEAPQAKWFVLPAGSTKNYGPAVGDAMRQWIREGRVAADALVWREGWSEWRKAAAAFPQLAATGSPLASAPSVSSAASVTVAAPVLAVPALAATPNGPVATPAPGVDMSARGPQAFAPSTAQWATGQVEIKPVEVAVVPTIAPVISPTAAPGSATRPSVVRRRSNTARNVTLVVLVLAVVVLAIPLVWVLANQ